MSHLLFVRHAQPAIVEGIPSREWHLSAWGIASCAALVPALRRYQPHRLIASLEPKAQETAITLTELLGVPWVTAPNLHEHQRAGTPFLARADFERLVADFFAHPDELVMGEETAAQALARFEGAVRACLAAHPAETLAIVTHGTVMTLFLAAHSGVEPFPFWMGLGLPALVVLDRESLTFQELINP